MFFLLYYSYYNEERVIHIYNCLSKLLKSEGIELFAPIPLEACKINKRYLLERAGISSGTVIAVAVPYLPAALASGHNISAYCAVRDYHTYYSGLWERVTAALKSRFPENAFVGFADHSPIDERDAAAKAGLGVIGKNGMLITEKYSSYVFLGELITDAVIPCSAGEIHECEGCSACIRHCPMMKLGQCLSAITQKKGELTPDERAAIRQYGSAWGCDICQQVCPHTKRAIAAGTIYTNVEYFQEDVIPNLTPDILNSMDDESFSARAFAWRGRDTVKRNLTILEEGDSGR